MTELLANDADVIGLDTEEIVDDVDGPWMLEMSETEVRSRSSSDSSIVVTRGRFNVDVKYAGGGGPIPTGVVEFSLGLTPNFLGVGVPLSNVELAFLTGVGPSKGPSRRFFDDASA